MNSFLHRSLICFVALLELPILSSGKEQHWAFQPLRISTTAIDGTSIDHFVEKKLTEEGLELAPEAERHTLIRRLSFDLRGLPPTPQEVAAFVDDQSADAWSTLVDRLLASPHFGERMAQQWLDLARHADTSGYAADRTRAIWPYRDWVVRSINENKAFDQFVIEQLAGDMLPDATPEQRLATGFHRNAMQAKGNNPRKEEFRVKGIVDRLTTTGRALMGLSIECAECHNHKYDPITQRDYYQLFAIFNNVPHLGKGYDVHGPLMNYLSPELREERRQFEREMALLPAADPWPDPSDSDWLGNWSGAAIEEDATFAITGDFSITASIRTKAAVADIVSKYDWQGKQRSFVFGIGGEGDTNGVPGHPFAWVSAKADPFNGVEIYASQPVNDGEEHEVGLVFRAGKSVHVVIDGVVDENARIIGKVPASVAVAERPLAIGAGFNQSTIPNAYPFEGKLNDVRLYGRALKLPEVPENRAALRSRLAAIDERALQVPVMVEKPEPRETTILLRGDFQARGERVLPAAPTMLPPMADGTPVNRLTFARWLVDENHALTSRVAVNYLWQHFFGTGIVVTPGDFGIQGSPPSHPALLDWLAGEFVRNSWDRKHLIRLIVRSRTYRQSSRHCQGDPQWLAGLPRLRLPAEQIRDQALSVAGLLTPTIGGAPVFPLQPDGYYEERAQNTAGNSNFTWEASAGAERYRKTLYVYWKRMALHPSLAAFDAPPRQVCIARRSITSTPQQALVTLNDPMFHECAVAFAKRIDASGDTDVARIQFAFHACLGRSPDPDELQRFLEFIRDAPNAWTSIAAVLLNLDETLTRE